MGDRFYMQQAAFKSKRRLKKDIIADITNLLNKQVDGLDKTTVATLDALYDAILERINNA